MVEEEGKFVPPFDETQGKEEESKEEEVSTEKTREREDYLLGAFIGKETLNNAKRFFVDDDGKEVEVLGESYEDFRRVMVDFAMEDMRHFGGTTEALSYLYTWLTEIGEDPDKFLEEAGVLEPPEPETEE